MRFAPFLSNKRRIFAHFSQFAAARPYKSARFAPKRRVFLHRWRSLARREGENAALIERWTDLRPTFNHEMKNRPEAVC